MPSLIRAGSLLFSSLGFDCLQTAIVLRSLKLHRECSTNKNSISKLNLAIQLIESELTNALLHVPFDDETCGELNSIRAPFSRLASITAGKKQRTSPTGLSRIHFSQQL
jgi:hypothetical protein